MALLRVPAGLLSAAHRRRLREQWRSAGWPCRDALELDLLAAGLLERVHDAAGRETVRVTDAGLRELAVARRQHQAGLEGHEAQVQQVALALQRAGRLVWCGLSLRAWLPVAAGAAVPRACGPAQPSLLADPVPSAADGCQVPASAAGRWVTALPDVFSIRHTTLASALAPQVHEIKVRRADLLGDLRRPEKGLAYLALASECWYVLRRGIGEVDEIPAAYGVMWADSAGLSVARPAPHRVMSLPFLSWMALARACPLPEAESAQDRLADQS